MEERAAVAEKRAEMLDKQVAELTAALTAVLNGTVIKDLQKHIAKAEKERDDAKSSDRQNRSDLYGTKSQKMKKLPRERVQLEMTMMKTVMPGRKSPTWEEQAA